MDSNESAGLSKRALKKHLLELLESVSDDATLLDGLEPLAQSNQHFAPLAHVWAPRLYRRNREFFGPFLAGHLWPWMLDFDKLADWVSELEEAQEVELFRRVYPRKTFGLAYEEREKVWTEDALASLRRADSRARRQVVLQMYSGWDQISDSAAEALYEVAPHATVEHLLGALDTLPRWEEPLAYDKLLARMKRAGDDNYWPLYQRCVNGEVWRSHVTRLCEEMGDARALEEALERHHPTTRAVPNPAATFIELLRMRGEAVLGYVVRHVEEFDVDHGYWQELADLAFVRRWWALWKKVVCRYLDAFQFSELVVQLVERGTSRSSQGDADTLRRLMDLGGAKHLTWQGIEPHHLREAAAVALYRRYPEIARGALREHFIARYDYELGGLLAYEKVARLAAKRGDEAFVDFLAGRICSPQHPWYGPGDQEHLGWYVDHYERLAQQPAAFARRAARALGHCETVGGNLRVLLAQNNALYRLLFGDPARFLEAPETVRDLVEASSPHVRDVGLAALSLDDPRALGLAGQCLGHLLAAPLEEHPRKIHAGVFDTLIRLADDTPALAAVIASRLREAADLLEPPFSRPRLIEAIARLLQNRPELRRGAEIPTVYDHRKESA